MQSVFVSGIGIVNTIDNGINNITQKLSFSNFSNSRQIFTESFLKSKIGFVSGDLNPFKSNKCNELLLNALKLAFDDSNQNINFWNDALLIVGTSTAGIIPFTKFVIKNEIDKTDYLTYDCSTLFIKKRLNLRCPAITISTACSSGAATILIAWNLIKNGVIKKAIVATTDALSIFVHAGFDILGAVSQNAPLPYSKERDGLVLGEGATALLLTDNADCNCWGEILGADASSDAFSLVSPHPDGIGIYGAVIGALEKSSIQSEQVDVLIPHATGTIKGDDAEIKAINKVYNKSDKTDITFFKGEVGHTLGNSSLHDIAIGLWMLKNNLVIKAKTKHPFIEGLNLKIAQKTYKKEIGTINTISSGFGGNNISVVIGKKSKDINIIGEKKLPLYLNGISVVRNGFVKLLNKKELLNQDYIFSLFEKLDESVEKKQENIINYSNWNKLDLISKIGICLVSPFKDKISKQASILLGTQYASWNSNYLFTQSLTFNDRAKMAPRIFAHTAPNAASAQISVYLKTEGPTITSIGKNAGILSTALAYLSSLRDEYLTIAIDATDELRQKYEYITEEKKQKIVDGGICMLWANEKKDETIVLLNDALIFSDFDEFSNWKSRLNAKNVIGNFDLPINIYGQLNNFSYGSLETYLILMWTISSIYNNTVIYYWDNDINTGVALSITKI